MGKSWQNGARGPVRADARRRSLTGAGDTLCTGTTILNDSYHPRQLGPPRAGRRWRLEAGVGMLHARPLFQAALNDSYLVDPASSHMLVSKIKPCMSKYERLYTVKLRMAH